MESSCPSLFHVHSGRDQSVRLETTRALGITSDQQSVVVNASARDQRDQKTTRNALSVGLYTIRVLLHFDRHPTVRALTIISIGW